MLPLSRAQPPDSVLCEEIVTGVEKMLAYLMLEGV